MVLWYGRLVRHQTTGAVMNILCDVVYNTVY